MNNNTNTNNDTMQAQEQPTMPPQGMGGPSMPTPEQPAPKGGSAGPVVGTIIVIVILIAGALYFFGSSDMNPFMNNSNEGADAIMPIEGVGASETSIEIDAQAAAAASAMESLDADLEADLDALDENLQ